MATSAEGSDLSWWLWPLEGLTGPVLSLSQRVLGAGEGRGSRGGKEEQGMETDHWHSASALHPIRFPPLPGPQAAVLGPAIIPCLLLSPFLGPHSSQGPADLILRLFLSNTIFS